MQVSASATRNARPSCGRRGLFFVGGLAVLVGLVAGDRFVVGRAEASRVFHNEAFRIAAFELPRQWTRSPQVGYPRVLLQASGPDGARLVLAAQKVTPGTTALSLAADVRPALMQQGFGDPRVSTLTSSGGDERARLDATTDAGRRLMRQLYAVDGDIAVVITAVVPAQRSGHAHEVDPFREIEAAFDAIEFAALKAAAPAGSRGPAAPVDGGPAPSGN